jgi:pilus assembly protein Flp/PilA
VFFFVFCFLLKGEASMLRKLFRNRKGQGLVEYGLIIAGVALICAAAVSIFGHKTNDLIAAVAAVLPGAHAEDNAAIVSGELIETANNEAAGGRALDVGAIVANKNSARLGNGMGAVAGSSDGTGFDGLVVHAHAD